jgi:uroporphyrinogen-III synthase
LLDWQLAAGAKIACIGPITAAAARAAGMPVHAVAMEYNMEGLLRALVALRQKERE